MSERERENGREDGRDTGRIRRGIGAQAQRILFGETVDRALEHELPLVAEVDRAHLVMLAESGLVARPRLAQLAAAVEALRASGFAALRGRAAPRGSYLVYEAQLAEQAGPEVAGVLATGRSRNDLNATTFQLRLRGALAATFDEAARLEAVILRRAWRGRAVAMPLTTHGQPAMPASYGFYLSGVAAALGRDAAAILAALDGVERCPLGANAVAGTTLPIDPARTAALLGFARPVRHALDAVASRDLALRALSAVAILGVTLSRVATDLLHLISAGWLRLPDHLVGSSSAMPQKRNPYFLEHVQGKAAAAAGAFASAAMAMHAKPFTNCIAVGTEGTAGLWAALVEVQHAMILLRLVIADAEVAPAEMAAAGERGHVTATELANRLVVERGLPFRRAHFLVGALVTAAVEAEETLPQAAARARASGQLELPAEALVGLSPDEVARAAEHGGGPGPASFARTWGELVEEWRGRRARVRVARARWREAAARLEREVQALLADVA